MRCTSWQLFGKWPKDKGIKRDKDRISGGCNKTQTFTKSCQEESSVRTHSWDFCRLFSPLVCHLENIPDSLPDHQPGTAPSSPSLLHHSWLNTAEREQHTLLKTSQTKPLVLNIQTPHRSPDSNPPRLWWRALAQITRHVALGRGPGAVRQGSMAVLIVFVLHMHLAAGDQTLAVALTAAGWTLEGRRNHQCDTTSVFQTGSRIGLCPFWGQLLLLDAAPLPRYLGPLPRDPDHLTGLAVAALHVRRTDQVRAVHLMKLPMVVVLTLQGPPPVTPSTRLAAL